MQHELPKQFRVFITGPFNSRLTVDYSELTEKYDDFRRSLYRHTRLSNNDEYSFTLESFQNQPEQLQKWLNQESSDDHQLIFSETQGITAKDLSLMMVKVAAPIGPDEQYLEEVKSYLPAIPVMRDIRIRFHENGVGVFSGYVDVTLTKPIKAEENQYRDFIRILRNAFVLSEALQKVLDEVDQMIHKAGKKFLQKPLQKKVMNIQRIHPAEPYATPLWGHALSIYDEMPSGERSLPFGSRTRQLLITSHPKGLIDMNYLSPGFVHLGWTISLAVGILPREEQKIAITLGQLQFYWRAAQLYNDIVMQYLEHYATVKSFSLKQIKSSMRAIEALKVESELFSANKMDYIKMLAPLSHNMFKQTSQSWRIDEMLTFFQNKMESLNILYQQGERKIEENIENQRTQMSNRLNILLSILALLTLFSWATDSIGFLDETLSLLPELNSILIGGKFLVIVMTPILVIGIFFLFFKIVREMKKVEK